MSAITVLTEQMGENERLRQQVADLTAKLAKVMEENADMKAQLTQESQDAINKQVIIDGLRSERARHTAQLADLTAKLAVCQKQLVAMDELPKHSVAYQQRITALEQQLAEATYRLDVLEPEHTACQARAAAAEGECDRLENAAEHWHTLYWDCAAEKADAAARYGQEIVDLEQGLAAAYLEVRHYREACASVGETDGHGWAETTKELRRQLAAMIVDRDEARDLAAHAEFDHDHYDLVTQRLSEAQATCDDLRVTIDSQRTQIILLQASDQAYAEASTRQMMMIDHYSLVQQQLARMQEQRDHEAMMHAACLTIAEGRLEWDVPFDGDSLATKSVRQLRQQLAEVTAERDAAETRNENYRLKLHARDQQLTEAIKDRDAWNGDANSHLHALCEKQAEVNGLEQGLAAAYLDVRHYREACASVGETDGHGWAETTKELRQQLAEVAQSCTWSQDGFGEDHYDTSCGRRFSLENGASPLENHMRFCCYCGHPLKEVLETEDPKENQS